MTHGEILEQAIAAALVHYDAGDGVKAYDVFIEELEKHPAGARMVHYGTSQLDEIVGLCYQPSRELLIRSMRKL